MKKYLLSLSLLFTFTLEAQFSVELEKESLEVLEGEVKEVKIQIHKDPKNLGEKFSVSLNACYPWVKLSKINSQEYKLTFFPNYVSLIDNDFYIFDINFEVMSSSGESVDKNLLAKIVNVDQLPILETQTSFEGSEFAFELTAFDPNGELSPTIEITSSSLPGTALLNDLEIEGDPYFPSSKKLFTWKNIPTALIGTSKVVSFKACTKNQLCSESSVELFIKP